MSRLLAIAVLQTLSKDAHFWRCYNNHAEMAEKQIKRRDMFSVAMQGKYTCS